MEIRKATEQDLEQLASIRDSIYRLKYTQTSEWIKDMFSHSGINILVADTDSEIAGFVMYSIENLFVRDLNIKEEFRKKGIGASLIKEAGKAFKEKGITDNIRYIPRDNECLEMLSFLEHNTDNIRITDSDYLSDAFRF